MKCSQKIIAVAATCLWLASFALAQEASLVEVEGNAAITSTTTQARADALYDAQYKAIEKAIGSIVSGQTLTGNYELIKDEVYTKATGFIENYQVIDEGKDKGTYFIKIRAKVSKKPLLDQLRSLGVLREWLIKIKIPDETVKASIEKQFLSAGYYVLSPGDKLRADIIIDGEIGKCTSNPQDMKDYAGLKINLINTIVQGSARAYRPDSGEIIVSDNFRGAGNDLDEKSSQQDALSKLGEEIGKSMVSKITDLAASLTRNIQIIFTTDSIDNLNSLSIKLKKVFGVRKINIRGFENNKGIMEVEYLGKSSELAHKIKLLGYPFISFSESSISISQK